VATADPAGRRRLRRVARACVDYGLRVQKSIFECQLNATQWTALKLRLFEEFDPKEDSLRSYYLDDDTRVEHHGCAAPRSDDEPFIV
jgi:CRISPR-associated protein Cas2